MAPRSPGLHKVWLPELDHVIVTKDIRSLELEPLDTTTPFPHTPVIISDHDLLRSYTWLTPYDTLDKTDSNDVVPSSLQPYSHQQHLVTHPDPLESSSLDHEWDHMMNAIEEAEEIVIDLDAIAADLGAELNVTMSEGGNPMQDLMSTLRNVPLLETPHSDTTADMYDDISILKPICTESPGPLSYTAFTTACSDTQAPTISDHHLDHMAFVVTVMNSTTLVVSRQQMCSANSILLEPLLLNEAKAHDDWHKWQEAMVSKMDSMHKMNVFELADVPRNGKLIGVRWVYKLKLNVQQHVTRYKACLVAQGYAQCQGLDYNQTFSLVICLQTVRILFAITCRYRSHATQLDVSTAFLNGKIDKDVHIQIPPTFEGKETEGKCYKLKEALYSLKQARQLWHAALDKQLQAFGFRWCQAEPCMYTCGSKDAMILLAVYIDDLLVIRATVSQVQSVQQQLSSMFSITDQGNVSHIIGLNVNYNQEACMLSIDQSRYIEGIIAKFRMDQA
ncbi:uncharacterized protein UHO2_00405 [Ustilago hordei]|uniref:uncharacterized protein n=1 Tax=Ustilago hordei TaxID=120017 RepID=UPI001A528946|nr:uncharacterized protein UHO2_00405 [Ustilago hordei]SYW81901.1 uncharacterized protein UHO2_00405 [Ustilago hordei]